MSSLSTIQTKDDSCEAAMKLFESKFGARPEVVACGPGRVNLIGEHTDYQEGYVFPAALDRKTIVCLSLNESGKFNIVSNDLKEENNTESLPTKPSEKPEWYSYIIGSILIFCEVANVQIPKGFNLLCSTTVPIGAGLSSSAALEVAVATAMEGATGKVLPPLVKARDVCQRAEHEWAKVPCGLMDQAISVMARDGHAMLFDCKTQKETHAPLPSDVAIVIVNSGVSHSLVSGHYANRRQACANAVEAVQKENPKVHSLRDVTPDMLKKARLHFENHIDYLRATHVVEENLRSEAFASALKSGNLKKAGEIMYAGHASLRDNYEVTVPETDEIVAIAKKTDGVIGARMTGGGFGGSVCVLVKASKSEEVLKSIMDQYIPFFEAHNRPEEGVKRNTPIAFAAVPSRGACQYKYQGS